MQEITVKDGKGSESFGKSRKISIAAEYDLHLNFTIFFNFPSILFAEIHLSFLKKISSEKVNRIQRMRLYLSKISLR